MAFSVLETTILKAKGMTGEQLASLAAAGVDARAALAAHASGAALEATGDLAFTGPTGTNVNDLKIGLVAGRCLAARLESGSAAAAAESPAWSRRRRGPPC